MTILEAIQNRHSVRKYTEKPMESEKVSALEAEIDACNTESGLAIRLVVNDAQVFSGFISNAVFKNAKNSIVLAGKDAPDLNDKAGYYGERIVLKAQQLGLHTCWAAMFGGKKYANTLGYGERMVIVISVGYGETAGKPHKSKPMDALCRVNGKMPDWFKHGMEAVMLAPSAINRQPVFFTLDGSKVKAVDKGNALSQIDLGIAKYHFEIGAGKENFEWM